MGSLLPRSLNEMRGYLVSPSNSKGVIMFSIKRIIEYFKKPIGKEDELIEISRAKLVHMINIGGLAIHTHLEKEIKDETHD